MARPAALHFALDLAAMPILAGVIQREPLPQEVLDVIKIAAGCADTCQRASNITGKRPEAVRDAAIVYLQTALFFPSADSYRVLGVAREAPQEKIRQHLHWLMKWLHPDRAPSDWESTFAQRVLNAWDDLKSVERRARYDRLHPAAEAKPRRSRQQWRRPWLPWVQMPAESAPSVPRSTLAGIAVIGLVTLALILTAVWSGRSPSSRDGLAGDIVDTIGADRSVPGRPAILDKSIAAGH